jgi:hypothetical protein
MKKSYVVILLNPSGKIIFQLKPRMENRLAKEIGS